HALCYYACRKGDLERKSRRTKFELTDTLSKTGNCQIESRLLQLIVPLLIMLASPPITPLLLIVPSLRTPCELQRIVPPVLLLITPVALLPVPSESIKKAVVVKHARVR